MSDQEQEQKNEHEQQQQEDWEGLPGDWCPHCGTSLHDDCMRGPDEEE